MKLNVLISLFLLASCTPTKERPIKVLPADPTIETLPELRLRELGVAAPDYELIAFENADFRDFTRGEFETKMGENAVLINYYICDGVNERDPFWYPLRTNPLKNSLRIKAYTTGDVFTYREGVFWNAAGEAVEVFTDEMLKYVQQALRRFETLDSTSYLLRRLEESYFPVTIKFGGNSFNPREEGGRDYAGIYMAQALMHFVRGRMADDALVFNNIGVGGAINWHPKLKIKTIEADGVARELDPAVALAHEMYHAFDAIRGLLDFRHVKSDILEFETVSEYRAVFFENLVRRELGFQNRKYYSSPSTPDAPSMLDEAGDTHRLPSPCLPPTPQ